MLLDSMVTCDHTLPPLYSDAVKEEKEYFFPLLSKKRKKYVWSQVNSMGTRQVLKITVFICELDPILSPSYNSFLKDNYFGYIENPYRYIL